MAESHPSTLIFRSGKARWPRLLITYTTTIIVFRDTNLPTVSRSNSSSSSSVFPMSFHSQIFFDRSPPQTGKFCRVEFCGANMENHPERLCDQRSHGSSDLGLWNWKYSNRCGHCLSHSQKRIGLIAQVKRFLTKVSHNTASSKTKTSKFQSGHRVVKKGSKHLILCISMTYKGI